MRLVSWPPGRPAGGLSPPLCATWPWRSQRLGLSWGAISGLPIEVAQHLGWVQAVPWLALRGSRHARLSFPSLAEGGVCERWGESGSTEPAEQPRSLSLVSWPSHPLRIFPPHVIPPHEARFPLQHPAATGPLLVTSPHGLPSNAGHVGHYTAQIKGRRVTNTHFEFPSWHSGNESD